MKLVLVQSVCRTASGETEIPSFRAGNPLSSFCGKSGRRHAGLPCHSFLIFFNVLSFFDIFCHVFPWWVISYPCWMRLGWCQETEYRLIKELFAFEGNRIGVCFQYEFKDAMTGCRKAVFHAYVNHTVHIYIFIHMHFKLS